MQLAIVLQEETEDHILAVTAWTIGQIGKHSSEHAKAVAAANILSKLLEVCENVESFLAFAKIGRRHFISRDLA